MSEEHKTVLEQFGLHRLYPRNSLFSGPMQHAACAIPFITESSLPSCCEFAEGKVSERSEGRLCKVDSCYCSPLIFRSPDLFKDCDLRLAQLAKKET